MKYLPSHVWSMNLNVESFPTNSDRVYVCLGLFILRLSPIYPVDAIAALFSLKSDRIAFAPWTYFSFKPLSSVCSALP